MSRKQSGLRMIAWRRVLRRTKLSASLLVTEFGFICKKSGESHSHEQEAERTVNDRMDKLFRVESLLSKACTSFLF